MAIQLNVGCKTLIKTGTGASNALEELGYTVDGVSIDHRMYREDIHSDQHGGTSGPPSDVMVHGEVHIITLDMVYWDPAVASKMQYVKGTTAGEVGSPCTLMFGDDKYYRVLLTGTGFTRNYLRVLPTSNNLSRIGTHASLLRLTLEAYPDDDDVLWNTTTA